MWNNIKGFEDYQVSTTGKVRNAKTGKNLTLSVHSKGYIRISLRKNGKSYFKYVHRLVAETFIDNPFKCEHVHHVDGDRSNNDVGNLEWVNPTTHAIHTFTMNSKKKYKPTPLICVKVDGSEIFTFSSIEEACYKMNVSFKDIKNVLNSKTKAINNYYWLYKYELLAGD